jgi:hypothetical protein
MKIRKRMGMPKTRLISPRRDVHPARSTIPSEIIEILTDRARRTIEQEQQLAAKQRRLLELAASGTQAAGGDSTIVRLAELMASRGESLRPG